MVLFGLFIDLPFQLLYVLLLLLLLFPNKYPSVSHKEQIFNRYNIFAISLFQNNIINKKIKIQTACHNVETKYEEKCQEKKYGLKWQAFSVKQMPKFWEKNKYGTVHNLGSVW